ncbi:MAG TPA: RNA methyltransferase [Allocoleopsis sp.]
MNKPQLTSVRIVLVETQGELNLGSVARIMKNMGLTQLVLVNPKCDRYSDHAKLMAVHAMDILQNAQSVDNIPQALIGCTRAIATTSRLRSLSEKLEHPRIC